MSKTLDILLIRKNEILAELAEINKAIAAIGNNYHGSESIARNIGNDTSGDFNPMHSSGYGRGDDERGGPNDR